MKLYRKPWTQQATEYIEQWWPHFGTYYIAEHLKLTRQQVKSKADKLRLKMLPKIQRLCLRCKSGYQFARHGGLLCKQCRSDRRKEIRVGTQPSLSSWIKWATNTAKHRSSIPSDLTHEYMRELWDSQKGRCYYSNMGMQIPVYGSPRKYSTASIDRIDSSGGYVKGNVAWVCWACNAGKNCFLLADYVKVCKMVAEHQSNNPLSFQVVPDFDNNICVA